MAFFEKKAVAEEEKFMVEMRQEFDALSSASDAALRYEGLKNLADKIRRQPNTLRHNQALWEDLETGMEVVSAAGGAALAFYTGLTGGVEMMSLPVIIEASLAGIAGLFGTAFAVCVPSAVVVDMIYGPGQRAMTKRYNTLDKIEAGLRNILDNNFEDLAASPRFWALSSKYPELPYQLEKVVGKKLLDRKLSESFRDAVRAELTTPKPMAAPMLSPLLKVVR